MFTSDTILKVDGLDIYGRLFLPGDGVYPALCVCHGIPAHLPEPGDSGYAVLAEALCREGFATFIFNFRGCGPSGGSLDMPGWARDLKAVIDHLLTRPGIDRRRLCLLGFSGGAAVAIYTAARDSRIAAVVSCACPAEFSLLTKSGGSQLIDHFRSIGAIKEPDFPPSLEGWFDGFSQVRPLDYVAGVSPRPLLLVHGSADETVAVDDAYRLYDRAGEPKEIDIISGAGHRLRQNAEAMALVSAWLKRLNKIDR